MNENEMWNKKRFNSTKKKKTKDILCYAIHNNMFFITNQDTESTPHQDSNVECTILSMKFSVIICDLILQNANSKMYESFQQQFR